MMLARAVDDDMFVGVEALVASVVPFVRAEHGHGVGVTQSPAMWLFPNPV